MVKRWISAAFPFALALVCLAPAASAQAAETYKVRLAPVASDAQMKSVIAGEGMFTATLTGAKFVIRGTFEGLKSNATAAHIHQGTAPGVRGGVLLNLDVTKAMSGDISGTFDLTPEQMENLHKGRWYVQIHSEKAPMGNLWGWIISGYVVK